MAALMAIVIAVLIDRGADYIPGGKTILQCRSVTWVEPYNAKIMEWLEKANITQQYVIVAALFIPLLLAVVLGQLLFVSIFGVIGKVLFMAITLLYFLGNNNLDHSDPIFVQAHERSYAILFWFAILCPIGALMYWFLTVNRSNDKVGHVVGSLHALAAWIPARITGFIYALVGNFTAGFKKWMECIVNVKMPSSEVLVDCGNAAVDTSEPGDNENIVLRAYGAWAVTSALLAVLIGY